MPYYCTVPRCTSMAGKAKNVSFHQFPRDEDLARLWNDILKRGKPYTKYSKVCSLHFRPEDYTITSVGKNKGQWRTLRKDAVPSRNLPSETPAPYSRKQWETWSQNSTPAVMDPSIQQHVAQAIYMQTMLAMQVAGATDTALQNGSIPPEMSPHTSTQEDTKHNIDSISYKCEECTKCFKDPDVFILHKRSHSKDLKPNGVEKENFNMNLTLQSNPILANLLKTNNDGMEPNLMTMEGLLMTALAANMDYLRNYSIGKDRVSVNQDDSNRESADSNRLNGDLNSRELLKSDPNNVTLTDKRVLSYTQCYKSRNDQYTSDFNEVSVSGEQINHKCDDRISERHEKSDPDVQNSDLSYAMNFSTKLSGRVESLKYNSNVYRERLLSSDLENDSENIENVRSQCDTDLNESMDSNGLVIDENV